MIHKTLVITFAAVAAFAVGCKPAAEVSTSEERKAMEAQIDKANPEMKEAAQDVKDYSYAQKGEFVGKMQNHLAEINRDLEQLAAKIEKSSDAAKAEAKPRLQALREQTAKLHKQVDEAKSATESTWDSVKATSEKALDSLKEGFQQSRQWLSDKIAP